MISQKNFDLQIAKVRATYSISYVKIACKNSPYKCDEIFLTKSAFWMWAYYDIMKSKVLGSVKGVAT